MNFDLCWWAEIIQVGLNMHLYDDIGDASSSLRGSTSSLVFDDPVAHQKWYSHQCSSFFFSVNDEHCQLLGTEEDSSDRHSSNDEDEDNLLQNAQVLEVLTLLFMEFGVEWNLFIWNFMFIEFLLVYGIFMESLVYGIFAKCPGTWRFPSSCLYYSYSLVYIISSSQVVYIIVLCPLDWFSFLVFVTGKHDYTSLLPYFTDFTEILSEYLYWILNTEYLYWILSEYLLKFCLNTLLKFANFLTQLMFYAHNELNFYLGRLTYNNFLSFLV